MADNRAFYGFRFYKGANGSRNLPSMEAHVVATGYDGNDGGANSVDLNIGDPVSRAADGSVTLCAAGAAIYGVVGGVKPYWDGEKMKPGKKLPNATVWGTNEARRSEVLVIPARNATFEVDVVGGSNTTEAAYRAHVGANADHVLTGDTSLETAKPQLAIAGVTTSTAQWRVVGVSQSGENRDYSGANVKLLVQANESLQAPATLTAGV